MSADPDPRPPRFKLKRAALLGIPLLAAAGLAGVFECSERRRDAAWRADYDAEGMLGRVTVASADPVLRWEYAPLRQVGWLETNEHGFREGPTPLAGPADEHRVAFVGDSVVLGWGVPPAQTFVRQLEQQPPSSWPSGSRALNFGIDGYHSLQVLRLLQSRVLAFGPDEVLYVLCLNDFDFDDASARKIDYFDPPRSFLWRRLRRGLSRRLSPHPEYHRRHFERHRSEVFAAIEEMSRSCQENGATFRLIVMPVLGEGQSFEDPPTGPLHQAIADFARERGIEHLDLLEPLRRTGRPPTELGQDLWHLSKAGHAVVAEALRQRL